MNIAKLQAKREAKLTKLLSIFILLAGILSGCSSEQHGEYIGFWEMKNEGPYWHPAVVEITEEDGNYIFRDAINFGNSNYQAILKETDGKLILSSQYIPELPLGLLDNKSTLVIGQRQFKPIKQSEIDSVRERVAEQKKKKTKN